MMTRWVLAAAVLFSCFITPVAAGQAPPAADDAARREAVAKGLTFLAVAVKAGEHEGPRATGGVAVASLSGLALLQSGSAPDAGPRRGEVTQCLELVLSSAQETGLLAGDTTQGPMYGHGFGMLFLAEAHVRAK